MSGDVNAVVEALAWETASWKTLAMRVRQDWDTSKGGPAGRIVAVWVETSDGRSSLRSTVSFPPQKTKPYQGAIRDGDRSYNESYGPDGKLMQVVVAKSFPIEEKFGRTIRPQPLDIFYVGLRPLRDVMPEAVRVGEARVIERPCVVYRFRKVKCGRFTSDFDYALDTETSVPLRIETRNASADPSKEPLTALWEAESLDVLANRHFPLRSRLKVYGPKGPDGIPKELTSQILTVEELKFDEAVPASTFRPEIPQGVNLIDTLNANASRPAKIDVEKSAAPPEALTSTPPESRPPTDWTTYAPLGGILLGAVLLVAALVARRKGLGG